MRRPLGALFALALAGCSIVLAPDRDAIVHLDGGTDGSVDGGDGGLDACVPAPEDCSNGADDDCDGRTDCFDPDCGGDERCCRGGGPPRDDCFIGSDLFRVLPEGASLSRAGDCGLANPARIDEFGPRGRTRALVSAGCQPVGFGMRLQVSFEIQSSCATPPCDHAALALLQRPALVDGQPLESELRVLVRADGSARVERGGVPMRHLDGRPIEVDGFIAGVPIRLDMELWSGADDTGRGALFATIDLAQDGVLVERLVERRAVIPLDDVVCLGEGRREPGLHVALEGTGRDAQVLGPLVRTERECSNPSQFRPLQSVDTSALSSCGAGGVGAPALTSYCVRDCAGVSPQLQWDLWLDASEVPRQDESFRFVDFQICGHVGGRGPFPSGAEGDGWDPRGDGPSGLLWPGPGSRREPTLLPISDDIAPERVGVLWYAYARPEGASDRHAIYGGQVVRPRANGPSADVLILSPADTGGRCTSVRDPLLVARYGASGSGHQVVGAWLFFTCDGAGPRTIGAVPVARPRDDLEPDLSRLRTDVITPAIGPYAARAAFAPEGFSVPGSTRDTIRLWFLARDGSGTLGLAFAQARVPRASDEVPSFDPYPANPVLTATSSVLGPDCGEDCALTGLSVTPSPGQRGDHQLLVARSGREGIRTRHQLVPLLQPAPPND